MLLHFDQLTEICRPKMFMLCSMEGPKRVADWLEALISQRVITRSNVGEPSTAQMGDVKSCPWRLALSYWQLLRGDGGDD